MPAPPEVLELVHSAYAVWNEGGPRAMAGAVWPPDFVYHFAPEFPGGGEVRGVEAVVTRIADSWVSAFGVSTMTPVQAWSDLAGERMLVELLVRQKGESSGVELDVSLFQLFRMSEGRPVECWDFLSREEAFEAAQRHV
jgi:hypothetical protein